MQACACSLRTIAIGGAQIIRHVEPKCRCATLATLGTTISARLFPLVIASLADYAFARIDFEDRDWQFIGMLALQIVTIQIAPVTLPSLWSRGVRVGWIFTEPSPLRRTPDQGQILCLN
ncbi:MAG: hypothetical protein ABIW81_02340 [Terrimesophilobacter sp.]